MSFVGPKLEDMLIEGLSLCQAKHDVRRQAARILDVGLEGLELWFYGLREKFRGCQVGSQKQSRFWV